MTTNLVSVTEGEHRRKSRVGVVVSDKMAKTRVVEVLLLTHHHLYDKLLRHKKRYYAHDEDNKSKAGDRVLLEETRPLSKLKRWRVAKVLGKGAA
ncbi:MAG: 30S ribosomal protein S17 [Elusimicrobia bacterium]|nr:30S ribosomal protein S17 [Elusimicrobiota bacterium]